MRVRSCSGKSNQMKPGVRASVEGGVWNRVSEPILAWKSINKFKEAYLVPTPKARWYCKVLTVKCFPGCAEGLCRQQLLSPQKNGLNNVLGIRWEGTFEWKVRLENEEFGTHTFGERISESCSEHARIPRMAFSFSIRGLCTFIF